MLIEPLPNPRNPRGDIPDSDFDVGDIIGLFFGLLMWFGFFCIVDVIGTAFEIPTLLAIPVTIAVCLAVFYSMAWAIALPFLAIEYCSTEEYSRCGNVIFVFAAFLLSTLIVGAVAAGFYAFL